MAISDGPGLAVTRFGLPLIGARVDVLLGGWMLGIVQWVRTKSMSIGHAHSVVFRVKEH